jgi:HSP20 family protein
MKKDDFKVEIKDGNLVISAETKEEKEEKGKNFTRREFNFSSFNRSFWLPENVKPGEVKATYKEGILYLSLPKIKVEKKEPAKLIEVK